jgi:DNA adenine methylase
MWRHNSNGEFNVGYGGQDRRWVISKETLVWVSKKLWRVSLKCCDFEEVIDACEENDFIFVDPPYRPGEREMIHDHYWNGKFSFDDHKRLAATLKKASARGIRWAITTSAHSDIVYLFSRYHIVSIPRGTGKKIGALTKDSGEVLILNYEEVSQ